MRPQHAQTGLMLSRLPAPVHRLALHVAHGLRLRLWRLMRMQVRGTNALVFDPAGRLLLVRHSYHAQDQWLLPGGGLGRGEDPVQTAVREVREETGCELIDPVWFESVVHRHPTGWANRIELIAGTTADTPQADGRELVEARFFPLDTLPLATNRSVKQALTLWQKHKSSKR